MMGKADAVIFDFDGVIADTREDVWDSVEYAANACLLYTSRKQHKGSICG